MTREHSLFKLISWQDRCPPDRMNPSRNHEEILSAAQAAPGGTLSNCPKCRAENREGVRFCEHCGTRVALQCPKCKANLPPGTRYCGECGQSLQPVLDPPPTDLSLEEKITRIQRYLPEGLAEKILSERDRIEGENKLVTVMFCDMEGYTTISRKLGPEGVYTLMDEVYEILIHMVNDFGGTVNELTGDGIMALFGAPIALEDAPQRAIRAALAIHREITRFSERMIPRGIPPVRMRAGIHSGPVVVGTVGNDLRVDFKAIGDTVNLAARLESMAEPGTTYVTEETFKLTEGMFRFENLGEREIKGKDDPVRVYMVLAPSSRRTRFDVSAESGLTPMIGRERELEILLDAYRRAKEGRGQVLSIVSEAGMGKSRLLYEFRKAIANEEATFLEGKCLSYSKSSAYYPIIDMMKSNFRIQDGDADAAIREKVETGLEMMGIDAAASAPYLLELLSVRDSGMEQILMSPEGKKDRLIETMKQIVYRGAEMRPLVMVIEDLHWADGGTKDVLKHQLESIPAMRVLLIFTYRPEFVHNWGGRSYQSQLTLNRLSGRASLTIAKWLLGTDELDWQVEELILSRTEGVPFFIEEFIKSLKTLKIIRKEEGRYRLAKDIQEFRIPVTIHDVIMARVDALPQKARELLQTGSVIEREFSYRLIKRVTGLEDRELSAGFSLLKESELLYECGISPHSTYVFNHALTRQVVYESLLAKKRKILHGEIGNAIEELGKVDEHCDVLAAHFVAGGNDEKGAEYCRLAARKAERAASFPDAIVHARSRVSCVERLCGEERQRDLVDARTILGLYLVQSFQYIEAKEVIAPVMDMAVAGNYRRRLGQIYTILGAYHYTVAEDLEEAFRCLRQALQISEEVKDVIASVLANSYFGCALSLNGEFDRALSYFQKSINANIEAKNLWGIASGKAGMAHFGHFFPGRIDAGFRLSAEATRIAEESGDSYSKGYAYTSHGHFCFGKGLFEEAEQDLLKGIHYCGRVDNIAYNMAPYGCLAECSFEMGSYAKAMKLYERLVQVLEQNGGWPSWISWGKLGLMRCKVAMGESELDLESMFTLAEKIRIRVVDGWASRYIGEVLLGMGHGSHAERWIQKAVEADQGSGMSFELGRAYALLSERFRERGDTLRAQESLARAIGTMKKCGADGWVARYEKDLDALGGSAGSRWPHREIGGYPGEGRNEGFPVVLPRKNTEIPPA
jgi:class 3 adenylate cyclase/tetratricopeptide (TPR) repeat protein